MIKYISTGLILLSLLACKSGIKTPDVSAYSARVVIARFDQDFFGMDTVDIGNSLNGLYQKYPEFLAPFLANILGVNPADPQAPLAIKSFLSSYRPVFKAANETVIPRLPILKEALELGLKRMQYYVPGYKPDSPFVMTTFVGPMDAFEPFATGDYGDVRTNNGVGIALQLHLGAGSPLYDEGLRSGVLYQYQTNRFTPPMMAVNAIKNLVNDAFPYPAKGSLNLVEEMVEKGKRMYLVDLLMAETPDSLQLGYTGEQVKGCFANEALIWNYFVKNDLLYSSEPQINQNYIKDGPSTQELGPGAPGYIGLFLGRQIVRAYMQRHIEVSISTLMKMPAADVFQQAGYKP